MEVGVTVSIANPVRKAAGYWTAEARSKLPAFKGQPAGRENSFDDGHDFAIPALRKHSKQSIRGAMPAKNPPTIRLSDRSGYCIEVTRARRFSSSQVHLL
jgi:hypothetical protein